ncbi:MAG: hypothetical protein P1U63_04935 [Coxiellaceae bacterium]|nr:hypothetical protein [Coxiellaceae bacterium]
MPKILERILPATAVSCTILSTTQTVFLNYLAFANTSHIRHDPKQMSLFAISQAGRVFFTFLLYHLFKTNEVTKQTGQWLDKKISCQPIPANHDMQSFYFSNKKVAALSVTLWIVQLAQVYSNVTTNNNQTHAIDDMSSANFIPKNIFWPAYYAITFGAQPIIGILSTQIITRKIIDDLHKSSANYSGKTRAAVPFALFGVFCNLVAIASSIFRTWAANASQCEGFTHPSTISSLLITAINSSIVFFAIGQVQTWMQRGDMVANLPCCKQKTKPTMLQESLLTPTERAGATVPQLSTRPVAHSRPYKVLGGAVLVALVINFIIAEITIYRTYGKLWEEGIEKGCPLKINQHLYQTAVISAMVAGLINGGSEVHTIVIGGLKSLKQKFKFFQAPNQLSDDAETEPHGPTMIA